MGFKSRLLARYLARLLGCAVLTIAACGPGAIAFAQSTESGETEANQSQSPKKPTKTKSGKAAKNAKGAQPTAGQADEKADPAKAERALEAGLKSYRGGNSEQAISQIDAALQSGGLPPQRVAKALYVRGMAYRKVGKPAQAISDLTSAVWMKGGLSDGERKEALEARAAAHKEAGIADPGASGVAEAIGEPSAQSEAAPQKAAQKRNSAAAKVATATATPGAPPAEAAPGGQSQTPPQQSGSQDGLGAFFNNLFGGGQASSPDSPPVEQKAPAPETTASTSGPAVASAWSSATEISPTRAGKDAARAAQSGSTGAKSAKSGARTAAVAAPPAADMAPANSGADVAEAPKTKGGETSAKAAGGRYRLQVATVRSREEAETLAARFKQQYGSAIAGREPVVDEAVMGNMGTFYRVRVGPFADANEPARLCSKVKPGGFDCLVVTQ